MQEITVQTNDLLTTDEARTILNYSRVHIWRLVQAHRLHPIYLGNRPFFSRKEIETYNGEPTEHKCANCLHERHENGTQCCACREICDIENECKDWVWKWS